MGTQNFLTDDEDIIFIQKYISDNFQLNYDSNDINYIVDLIYEFYEKIGMFNENAGASKDITIDENEVTDFVMKCLKEDGMNHITKEMTEQVIEAEFAYCESIGIFE